MDDAVGVTLEIENVPDTIIGRLRQRAARRDRSLEAELLEIITDAVDGEDISRMTLDQVAAEIHALGLTSVDESASMVREDRDRANGRR